MGVELETLWERPRAGKREEEVAELLVVFGVFEDVVGLRRWDCESIHSREGWWW